MWTPTHVQVTVLRARNLVIKGKGGHNDAFVTIQLGREKYQTSVKEKASQPEWNEECDLELVSGIDHVDVTVHHRNFIGLDEFLGTVSIPLEDYNVYDRPKSKWYSLQGKPGRKEKYRGELEVKVTFIVLSKPGAEKKIKRAGSVKNLTEAVSGTFQKKLKLLGRNNSFKSDGKSDTSDGAGSQMDTQSTDEVMDRESQGQADGEEGQGEVMNSDPIKPASPPADGRRGLPYVYQGGGSPYGKLYGSSWKSQSMDALHISHKSPSRNKHRKGLTQDEDSKSVTMSSTTDDVQRSPKVSDTQRKLLEERARLLQNIQKGPSPSPSPKMQRSFSEVSDTSMDSLGRRAGYKKGHSSQLINNREIAQSLSSLREEHEPASPSGQKSLVDSIQSDSYMAPNQPITSKENMKSPDVSKENVVYRDSLKHARDDKRRLVLSRTLSHDLPQEHSKSCFDVRRHTLHAGMSSKTAFSQDLRDGFRGDRRTQDPDVTPEVLQQYEDKSKEDLVKMVLKQKKQLDERDAQIKELEQYIDNLLVRVMETTPKLLQKPQQRPMSPLVVRTHTNHQSQPQSEPRPSRLPLTPRGQNPRVQIEMPRSAAPPLGKKKQSPLIKFQAKFRK